MAVVSKTTGPCPREFKSLRRRFAGDLGEFCSPYSFCLSAAAGPSAGAALAASRRVALAVVENEEFHDSEGALEQPERPGVAHDALVLGKISFVGEPVCGGYHRDGD